jgi:hypothetical protein
MDPHASAPERALPPIQQIAVAVLALIVIGGIYTAAHLPRHVPQGPAVALLAAAVALLGIDVGLLARIKCFAWSAFRLVYGWVLAAYLVIAGMLEYVFIYDHTRGTQLLIISLMLVVFAVDIPLLLGFSVARFQDPRAAEPVRGAPTLPPQS